MKQKVLSITSGIPGSGKSTWLNKNRPDAIIISRDEIRFSLLKKDEDYFSHENEVLNIFYNKINEALNSSEDKEIIIDATHLSKKARTNLFSHINMDKVGTLYAYCFDIPLEVCFNRNEKRKGRAKVPKSVIRRMYFSFEPPSIKEGFKEIFCINTEGEVYKIFF